MKIAFRCDWGPGLGIGHAGRCASLAQSLRKLGHETMFISNGSSSSEPRFPGMEPILRIDALPEGNWNLALNPDPASPGFREYEALDARESTRVLREQRVDRVILDHYFLSDVWARHVRESGIGVSVIDDIDRSWRNVDAVVDPRPGASLEGRVAAGTVCFAGTRYFPVSESTARARWQRITNEDQAQGAVIFTGGSDSSGLSARFITALRDVFPGELDALLIIGNSASDRPSTTRLAESARIRVSGEIVDIGGVYAGSLFALGAGGVSALERCCIGVPQIVSSVSENQVPQCRSLSSMGSLVYVGSSAEIEDAVLGAAIRSLARDATLRASMAAIARNTIDEHGATRSMLLIHGGKADPVFREASRFDVHLLFGWANEAVARANATNPALISWEEHVRWFTRVLNEEDTRIHVLEVGGVPVGMVRLDRQGNSARISYSVDVDFRSRGFGQVLLERALLIARESSFAELTALVSRSNEASLRLFRRLGFSETDGPSEAFRLFVFEP